MSFQFQFVFALILMSLISIKCDDLNEEPVELMTTQEPIDTANDLEANVNPGVTFTTSIPVNCSMYTKCDACGQNNCSWVTCTDVLDDYSQCSEAASQNCTVSSCEHDACKNVTDCEQCGKTHNCTWLQCVNSDEGPYCGQPAELCSHVACNATIVTTTAHPNDTTTVPPIDTTTVTPNDTTTTSAPPDTTTTTTPPETTTTSLPDTTTSPPSPDTTTSTPSPDTTTSSPSPDTTTASPSPDTTTTAPSTTTPGPAPTPSPQSGGFSAGSFFGGITLTLALLGVGLGGYKFYRTRYDVNYRTL